MYKNVNMVVLLIVVVIISVNCQNEDVLVQVHTIFRHGNRTPTRSYPNDPHINETYYPYGFGQLTNKGKNKEYLLGKALRARYGDFLGPIYTPSIIDPISTSFNRTKMSLELVLAGLFPPKRTALEWQKELNWQPIPYNYWLPSDHRLSLPVNTCPKYTILQQHIQNTTIGIILQKKHSALLQYLMKHTGLKVIPFGKIIDVYSNLVAQEDFGLKLPLWTEAVYPKYLEEAIGDYFQLTTSTSELKQLTGGFLLQKIVNDMEAKIKDRLFPPDRKLFLYSAHDVSLMYLLSAMNIYVPHVPPPYGTYILIELHKINNTYGIKVLYQDYSEDTLRILKVPDCDYFCPFKQFMKLFQENLPVGNNPCNNS